MDEAFLTDLLECSVCLEQLDSTSKVLPCQHTFCRRCLDEIVHSHKELRCPECRILVECSVDELPLNILLVRLLEGIKNNPRLGGGGGGGSRSTALLGGSSLIGHHHHAARPLLATSQSSSAGGPPRVPGDGTAPATGRVGEVGVRTLVKQLVPQMPCAKALYSYDAKDPGDLAFRKGDVIVLRKRVDQNWFHGELGGKQGFVPASYVQVVVPLPSHVPQCKALYDFRMAGADNDEKDCLSFLKGDVITVIRRVDENWAEGKLGERIGIFPISFVEMNAAGKALMKLSNNVQVGPSRIAPPTPNSEAPSQTVIPAGSTPSAGESQSSTTSPASSSPSPGTPPSTSPPLPACQSREKRHSLSALNPPPAAGNGANPQAPHRHSMEVLSTGTDSASQPSSPPQGQAASPSRIPTPSTKPVPATSQGGSSGEPSLTRVVRRHSGRKERDPSSLNPPGIPLPPSEQPATLLAPLTQPQPLQPAPHAAIASFYVALYSYKPQKEDELELRKNELYSVTEKCQDGWFKGTSLRTGLSGVFPGNYVQPAKSSGSSFGPVLLPLQQQHQQQQQQQHQQQQQQQQQQQAGTRIPAPSSPRPRLCTPQQQMPIVSAAGPPPFLAGQGSSPLLAEWALAVPPQRAPLTTTPSPLGHKPPVSQCSMPLQVQQLGVTKAVTGSPSQGGSSGPAASGHWLLAWPPSGPSPYVGGGASTWVPACATPTRSPAAANPAGTNSGTLGGGPSGGPAPSTPGCSTSSAPNPLAPSASALRLEKQKERKEKDKISLMKRLTAKRRSRSPPPPNFSCDNPSFVDSSAAAQQPLLQQPPSAVPVVHIRSGSCPSEALGSQQALHKKTSSLDGSDSLKARPKQPVPLVRERFRCIVPYPPNSEYELELKQGDVVYVHKKREDGWFKGTLQRTGKTGLFPGSFVEGF